MSHSQPRNQTDKPSPREDEVLSLEEENEGSTDPVGRPAVDGAAEADEEADRDAPRRGEEKDTSSGEMPAGEGTSTGGFETLLGKVVVEAGLVTPDEVELCNSLLRESSGESAGESASGELSGDSSGDSSGESSGDSSSGGARTLSDLLIENEFITRRQLDRIRSEFEAKKSSQRIPGYKISRRLGSGAMATVFLARQLSLDRLVAIKVLPKKFSANKKFIERFYKEGRAAAQLNHPNIVQAYDVGQAGDHHYFVMEYVDGETVYDRVAAHKRMSEKEAIRIIRQSAQALKHAHEKGFIHRDIKPKNIMITKSGVVKLADLGLARAMTDVQAAKAEAGRAYGTPYYISPEQIRGEINIGPPADIYGLGATFYHMVTGRVPFEGKNPSAVMHKHLKAELVPPDHINPRLSAGCAQVIEMMMAKNTSARYRNAADLLTDLDLIARGKPPHFAHRGFNIDLTAPLAQQAASAPSAPVAQRPRPPGAGAGAPGSPMNMVLLMLLIASVLANVVLALLLFA